MWNMRLWCLFWHQQIFLNRRKKTLDYMKRLPRCRKNSVTVSLHIFCWEWVYRILQKRRNRRQLCTWRNPTWTSAFEKNFRKNEYRPRKLPSKMKCIIEGHIRRDKLDGCGKEAYTSSTLTVISICLPCPLLVPWQPNIRCYGYFILCSERQMGRRGDRRPKEVMNPGCPSDKRNLRNRLWQAGRDNDTDHNGTSSQLPKDLGRVPAAFACSGKAAAYVGLWCGDATRSL